MSIWKNVLVYADGRPESEVALTEGLRLASHATGRVMAMDVIHHAPTRIPPGLLVLAQQELLELMLEQRDEQLQENMERLQMSAHVEVKVACGNPAFELIRQAASGRHDLIVKAARGRDVRHMTSFGTTALHLVRKSQVPVLLMSPDRRLLDGPKVLCAVDPTDDDTGLELNRALLSAACALAEVYGAQVHVLHVIDTQKLNVYRCLLSSDAFAQFVQGWHRTLQTSLEQLLARELHGLSGVHEHLLEGDPADTIVKMVAAEKVSHLVMGSVGHLEPGRFIGNLAEEVLSRIDCSLLTIKPSGFVTPIALATPDQSSPAGLPARAPG